MDDDPILGAEDIYEEFIRRRAAGEDVSIEDFCSKYPQFAGALRGYASVRKEASPPGEPDSTLLDALTRELSAPSAPQLDADGNAPPSWDPQLEVHGYTILGRPEIGGFGAVYRAEHLRLRRVVALKITQPGKATPPVLARFHLEQEILARMSHASIAQVFEVGDTVQGHPFVAMEYVDGPPITVFCDRQRLSLEERIRLYLQVCDAVQHAHQKGVIHRDLKPSNVLVAGGQESPPIPKVIDFGLAKVLNWTAETDPGLSKGFILGTPQYMAPEQTRPACADVDTRADVYSLGVLLYELLVGAVPFQFTSPDVLEMLQVIREQEPARPSKKLSELRERAGGIAERRRVELKTLNRALRGDLDWILRKAMEKDRDKRYPSPADLAADLQRHLVHQPVLAGPPSAAYHLRKFLRRHRTAVGAAGLALLILAGLGGFEYWRTLSDARGAWKRYATLNQEVRALKGKWDETRGLRETWAPVWRRSEELEARERLQHPAAMIEPILREAIVSIHGALRYPRFGFHGEELARVLEVIYLNHYREGEGGGPPLGKLGQDLARQGIGRGEPQGPVQAVRLESDPPGAEIHLFRYQEYEARLYPFPYPVRPNPAGAEEGCFRIPPLIIDDVWPSVIPPEKRPPFESGDRVLALRDRNIRNQLDFAAALEGVNVDENLEVLVLRRGRECALRWVPFPHEQATRLAGKVSYLHPYYQFGFAFAAYDLEFSEENRAGSTPFEAPLPPGSYLAVFRKEGYVDARLPLSIPHLAAPSRVKLIHLQSMPPGFIYVPEGMLVTGDDPGSFDSLPPGRNAVPGFLLSRLEVTQAEWAVFANDPGILAQTDRASGRARSLTGASKGAGKGQFQLVPVPEKGERPQWLFEDDRWRPLRPNRPALRISYQAALEYISWRNQKEKTLGKRWTYRLPTDLEWERAARGEDGRFHVWGNYLVWASCVSLRGKPPGFGSLPEVGVSPIDESVFGIRDLAGSVAEYTSGLTLKGMGFRSYRGGNYESPDEYEFRCASRNGITAQNPYWQNGFRLAADLPPEPER